MNMTENIAYVAKLAVEVFKSVMDKRNAEKIHALQITTGEMYTQTQGYIDDMMQDAAECSQVIVDIFSEALRDAGHEITESRSMVRPEIESAIRREFDKRLTVLPYTPEKGDK